MTSQEFEPHLYLSEEKDPIRKTRQDFLIKGRANAKVLAEVRKHKCELNKGSSF